MSDSNKLANVDYRLKNLTNALYLDGNDDVVVRTGFAGDIVISGNVNVPGEVTVVSSHENPLHTETHLLDENDVEYSASNPFTIDGTVTALQGTDPWTVDGTVELGATTLSSLENINANVTGTVSINQPVAVTDNDGSLTVDGTVSVDNFPATQTVDGTVTIQDGGGSITIDGNVGIVGNVTVDNFPATQEVTGNVGVTGNVNVTQGTDPWVVSGNVTVDDGGESITVDGNVGITGTVNASITGGEVTTNFNPTNLDAFGRLRISNPYTLFDTRTRYFDHDQFASNVVGAGNVSYDANSSTFLMSVTNTSDSVKRQTYRNFIYQPGKSLLVLNTFCGTTPTAGLMQRVGYFDDNNGVFLEVDGTTINLVIRSKSSGSLTHERIPQSSWNGDRLDGLGGSTNLSGITLNVATTQIFWSDIEWLGVGSVRVGFVINGQFIVCHTFHHANQSGNVTTYMTTASLPIRYEISSSGTSGTLRQICSTVISEGGYSLTGDQKSVSTPFGSAVTLPNDDSFLPIISIRLRSDRIESIVLPKTFSVSVSSNDLYAWKIYRKAITTGGSWANVGADSSVQVNYGPTSLSSGDVIDEGFIRSSNQTASSPSNVVLDWERQLMREPFTNQSYEFVIAMATTGTNQDAYASIQFQEIT